MKKLLTIGYILSILILFFTLYHCVGGRMEEPAPSMNGWPEFPWPPPRASAFHNIPNNLLLTQDMTFTLGDIASKLEDALQYVGYTENTYLSVPDGFALVTRLEQINRNGTSKAISERYSIGVRSLTKFSLGQYINALFNAREGFYRVIVFIVTPYPFSQAEQTVSREQADEWLRSGVNKLPFKIARIPYANNYSCTALIYEFVQKGMAEKPALKIPSRLTGKQHLEKARIWEQLGN